MSTTKWSYKLGFNYFDKNEEQLFEESYKLGLNQVMPKAELFLNYKYVSN